MDYIWPITAVVSVAILVIINLLLVIGGSRMSGRPDEEEGE